ncbi:TonB-dependent receptor plug domain-containing protein [Roseivirga sp.]|uniref:TonB-dependent receptor plug domain-containing protein n=1 Tax=Roseivirga sp. TaxID=1964215 RepID=UPI002B267C67|nr:TonB-dependent receptor plug domain-containing protein [Roseivirga sp.]
MKYLTKTIVIFSILLFGSSCARNMQNSRTKAPEKDYSIYQTLGDALQSLGTLKVTGQGGMYTVNLIAGRYANTNLMSNPGSVLYVINGVDRSKDYGAASSLVTPKDILSIRVLNGPEAVMRWGERGTGGVVLITTKEKEMGTHK